LEIELNDAEQRLARFLAKQRHSAARKKGIKDKRIGKQSAELTDLEGIAAEIAVAKAMNVYPDLETGHTPKADLVSKRGSFVDVKSTRYPNGRLLAAPWKKGDGVDQYVLVVGEFPKYRIAGVLSAKELLKDKRLKDLGHGKGFAAEQSELKKFPFK